MAKILIVREEATWQHVGYHHIEYYKANFEPNNIRELEVDDLEPTTIQKALENLNRKAYQELGWDETLIERILHG